ARHGIPVAAILVMSGYERAIALVVSTVLAITGAYLLFGRLALDFSSGGTEFIEFAVVALLAVFLGGTFAWGREAQFAVESINKLSFTWRAARSFAVSLL